VMLEAIATQSRLEKRNHGAILFSAKDGLVGMPVEESACETSLEIFYRIRAFMTSLAYTSLAIKDSNGDCWFSYQDCEACNEMILTWLHARYGEKGQRPPVKFFRDAWVQTQAVWSDSIRVHGKTMAQAVAARYEWSEFWTKFVPSAGGAGGATMSADLKAASARSQHLAAMNKQERARSTGSTGSKNRDYTPAVPIGGRTAKGVGPDGGVSKRETKRLEQHNRWAANKNDKKNTAAYNAHQAKRAKAADGKGGQQE